MKTTNKTSESANRVINLIDYSEKSFAAVGDTKAVKLQLMQLGGKFNPALRCGAGWIFSKKRLAQVTKVLGLSTDLQPCTELLESIAPDNAEKAKKQRVKNQQKRAAVELETAKNGGEKPAKKATRKAAAKKAAETTLALAL